MNLFKHDYIYISTNLLMYILSFVAFIIGLKYKKKHQELSHLYLYALASFLQNTISIIFFGNSFLRISFNSKIDYISIAVFIIVEFFSIYFFFLKTKIITDFTKKILPIFFIGFLCFYFTQLITNNFIEKIETVYFYESCFILIPCFFYLFQLFIKPPTLNLLNEPSFWFNAGILIYLTLTLPVFFMIEHFNSKSLKGVINEINFIGYGIVFSFLIKAYLCKPKTMI